MSGASRRGELEQSPRIAFVHVDESDPSSSGGMPLGLRLPEPPNHVLDDLFFAMP